MSRELTWRGGKGVTAKVDRFINRIDLEENLAGRIEYNPVFTKTTQGRSKELADSKWVVKNQNNIIESRYDYLVNVCKSVEI